MSTTLFFRDSLILDDTLFTQLKNVGITPAQGDTLVLGAANCTLTALASGYNYVILADTLTTVPSISLAAWPVSSSAVTPFLSIYANTIASPSGITAARPSVPLVAEPVGPSHVTSVFSSALANPITSIQANPITSPLSITYAGDNGANGTNGANGSTGATVIVPPDKPKQGPGGAGGNGGNGGDGATGGSVTIRYASASAAPTASAPGGTGGKGGIGGAGGMGDPYGKSGTPGRPGKNGAAGVISISQAPLGQVFTGLESDWLNGWSDYRTDVGEYLFRLFDAASQLHALTELTAAVELNASNTLAATLRTRIIQQETPTGLARDLDMAPDYKDVSAGLLGETQLVLSEYLALQSTATQEEIAAATKDQFSLVLSQLNDRLTESQLDLTSANEGVQVATADLNSYETQIEALQQQIITLQNQPMSLGDIISTLGSIVGAITGLVTGVGAIVSIPAALAASSNPPSAISQILSILATGKTITAAKSVGGDLSDLIKGGTDSITDFDKVYNELSQSANGSAETQLAQQVATLSMQQMVANLRVQQANDTVAAAQARVTDYAAEVQTATTLVNEWSDDEAFLASAVNTMLNVARALTDIVAEDVFIARRALEIYQLEDASSVHFDYGWLHPDQDNNLMLQPLQRAQLSLQSVATLPTDVITWNDIFVSLNESEISGFDVIHPNIEVTIDDPTALASLSSGGGVRFSVGIGPNAAAASIPENIFELKVNNLSLELDGVTASGAAEIIIQHTGHWIMNPRPTTANPVPPAVEFTLFPHVEFFNLQEGPSPLTSQIPAQPQSSAEPGPPFSFWGRGALADWCLFTDSSISALNLAGLSSIKLTIGCIALVTQGATAPTQIAVSPSPLVVMPPQPKPAPDLLVPLATQTT